MNLPKSVLTKNQVQAFGPKTFTRDGYEYKITAHVRYDDSCGNGHNSLGVTADVYSRKSGQGRWCEDSFGCQHELVVEHFPELAPLIKFHLCSSDGPMHYLENSLYHASDRDHNGKLKGEVRSYETSIFFNDVPIAMKAKDGLVKWMKKRTKETPNKPFYDLTISEIAYVPREGESYKFEPKYTFAQYQENATWYQCPFDSKAEAEQWLAALQQCKITFMEVPSAFGEGKEPNLEAARSAAIWPEASLEDFTKENLEARLPALMKEFKAVIESLGLVY